MYTFMQGENTAGWVMYDGRNLILGRYAQMEMVGSDFLIACIMEPNYLLINKKRGALELPF